MTTKTIYSGTTNICLYEQIHACYLEKEADRDLSLISFLEEEADMDLSLISSMYSQHNLAKMDWCYYCELNYHDDQKDLDERFHHHQMLSTALSCRTNVFLLKCCACFPFLQHGFWIPFSPHPAQHHHTCHTMIFNTLDTQYKKEYRKSWVHC